MLKLAEHPVELPRREFLYLATGAAALPAWLDAALALDYPTRLVHLVVGFPAGFTPDIIARLTAQALSERLGKQIIVDNRPGAASNIGTELVVRSICGSAISEFHRLIFSWA